MILRVMIILALGLAWAGMAQSQRVGCTVTPISSQGVNLRGGPGTIYARAGLLDSNESAVVTGQRPGEDGFNWWRTFTGGWVRADVVTASQCDQVPIVEPPPDYCLQRTELSERPALSGPVEQIQTNRFMVHYTRQGRDSISDTVLAHIAETLERSLDVQVDEMGWPLPPPDCGEGGDERFDVYVLNLSDRGIYGFARPEEIIGDNPNSSEIEEFAAYSFLAIDNDFEDAENALDLMRATVAHEIHHNIQFTYDFGEPYNGAYEAGATWMETQVYPDSEDATGYVEDYLIYPDLCPGATPPDPFFGSRIYAEWLVVDSFVRDHRPEALHQHIWRALAEAEGLPAYYDGLRRAGTTPSDVYWRAAVRMVLNDYSLRDRFRRQAFVEAVVHSTGRYKPRRDGVQGLGFDLVVLDQAEALNLQIDPPVLRLYVVGLRLADGRADVIALGAEGVADLRAYDSAYVIIFNPEPPDDFERCATTDWALIVEAGDPAQAVPPNTETWSSGGYIPQAQLKGVQVYPGYFRTTSETAYYQLLSLPAGATINVRGVGLGPSTDLYAWVAPANARTRELASDDDTRGLDPVLTYTTENAGNYMVGLSNFAPGPYRVIIGIDQPADENLAPANTGLLALPILSYSANDGTRTFTGVISSHQRYVHVNIEGLRTGETLYVYGGRLSGDIDPYLGLTTPNASDFIALDDDSGSGLDAALSYTSPDGGPLTLFLLSYTGGGTYRLTMGVNAPEILTGR